MFLWVLNISVKNINSTDYSFGYYGYWVLEVVLMTLLSHKFMSIQDLPKKMPGFQAPAA
jgi:hypothetical protein